jgi:DNA-binding MarR family transcriptional regulator
MHTINKQMKMIYNSFAEKRNHYLLQYNLTSAQMDILFFLKNNEEKEIHQRQIEQWLGLKNPTVTGTLNRLEEKGFIVRRTNASDKRYRVIQLTEEGRRTMENIGEAMWQFDEKVYGCLTEEERKQLSDLLDKILHSLSVVENKQEERKKLC